MLQVKLVADLAQVVLGCLITSGHLVRPFRNELWLAILRTNLHVSFLVLETTLWCVSRFIVFHFASLSFSFLWLFVIFEHSQLMLLLICEHFLLGDLLRLVLLQLVDSQLQLELGLRQHSLELISRHDV